MLRFQPKLEDVLHVLSDHTVRIPKPRISYSHVHKNWHCTNGFYHGIGSTAREAWDNMHRAFTDHWRRVEAYNQPV